MSVNPIRVALVGIGGYGVMYVDQMLKHAGAHEAVLVAGIDPCPERSSYLPALRDAGVPLFPSLEAFHRADRADLVVISAPIHLHAPLTIQALAQGSNVLCEKPLCATLAEADRLADAERAAGRFVAVGYQWSFSAAMQAMKRDLLAGRLGRPKRLKTITLWPRPLTYYARNDWAGRLRTESGAWVFDSPVNNATAHYLHNMLYLLGRGRETSAAPEAVEARLGRANRIENFDVAALRLAMPAGVRVLMLTTHAAVRCVGPLASYEFEHGTVTLGEDQVFRLRWRRGGEEVYGSPNDSQANKLWESVAAVRTGARPACGIEVARCHTAVVDRLQKLRIHDFSEDRVALRALENGDQQVWVRGLEDSFERAYADWQLPDIH
jgi:predicted dehydrogenase